LRNFLPTGVYQYERKNLFERVVLMNNTKDRITVDIFNEVDFEALKNTFQRLDLALIPIVKEAADWDPSEASTGLKLKKNMEKVNSLIPLNVTVADSLDKYTRMDIYEFLMNAVESTIDKLSDIAEINISEKKDDIYASFQTRMNDFFQGLKEESVDVVKQAEQLKEKIFKIWLYSILKLKDSAKSEKDSFSRLEQKIKNGIKENFKKTTAKEILKEVKIMKKEMKTVEVHEVIGGNLLPVVDESVKMFQKILDKIDSLKREIYTQTNEILNENKKCDIIFEPFIKLMDLFQNTQKDFANAFGELAKTKLNSINMKAQNISAYIKKSRMIINKNDTIASNNNAAYRKYNDMETIVEELRMNAENSKSKLNNCSKVGEITLVVEKTSQLFAANENFVEKYINWWGKNEFITINHALDSFTEMLPLQA